MSPGSSPAASVRAQVGNGVPRALTDAVVCIRPFFSPHCFVRELYLLLSGAHKRSMSSLDVISVAIGIQLGGPTAPS